jgi:hypothetical protein
VGSYLAYALRVLVGQAADLPPVLFAVWSFTLLRERKSAGRRRKASALFILFAVFVTMLEIIAQTRPPAGIIEVLRPGESRGGGMVGRFLGNMCLQAFGFTGSAVVLTGFSLVAAVLFAETPVAHFVETVVAGTLAIVRSLFVSIVQGVTTVLTAVRDGFADWRDTRDIKKAKKTPAKRTFALFGRRGAKTEKVEKKRTPKTERAQQVQQPQPPSQEVTQAKPSTKSPAFTDPFSLPVGSGRKVARKNPLGVTVDTGEDQTETRQTQVAAASDVTGQMSSHASAHTDQSGKEPIASLRIHRNLNLYIGFIRINAKRNVRRKSPGGCCPCQDILVLGSF